VSIRLRLALWYGGLTGLVLVLVSLATYALHTRAHYDDLDRAIVQATEHIAEEYAATSAAQHAELLENPTAPDVIVRAYHADGSLLSGPDAGDVAPAIDPLAIATSPSESPLDPVARLAPALVDVHAGTGALDVESGEDGRWRVYVLPVGGGEDYLVALAPLERLDASVRRFRLLVCGLTLAGAAVTLLAGFLLAGRALRPVAVLTATAQRIARSRQLDERVPVNASQDELGRLTATVNTMLASLQQASDAQQRFVSDASHELRAPLTIIQANLDLLERVSELPAEERAEILGEASRETHRLSQLVADLLALARADAGISLQRRRVELDRVLLDAVADARHLARGQRLEIDALEPVVVSGDPDRLRQLLLALLDNAVKYTPAGGRIGVALVRHSTNTRLTVSDDGVGIPTADLPHVFDRFYRADPARSRDPGGTGLGLPIARWIVEQHGGDISVTSDPGEGTQVRIQLPIIA
jgi:signal transduction histidine kinase